MRMLSTTAVYLFGNANEIYLKQKIAKTISVIHKMGIDSGCGGGSCFSTCTTDLTFEQFQNNLAEVQFTIPVTEVVPLFNFNSTGGGSSFPFSINEQKTSKGYEDTHQLHRITTIQTQSLCDSQNTYPGLTLSPTLYNISRGTSIVSIPYVGDNSLTCGTLYYEVRMQDDSPLHSFISFSQLTKTLYLRNVQPSQVFFYKLKVVAKDLAGHETSRNFTLNIYDGAMDCYQLMNPPTIRGPDPIVYAVGSGVKVFQFQTDSFENQCQQFVEVFASGLPSFVTFFNESLIMLIDSSDFSKAGTYTIKLWHRVRLVSQTTLVKTITLKVSFDRCDFPILANLTIPSLWLTRDSPTNVNFDVSQYVFLKPTDYCNQYFQYEIYTQSFASPDDACMSFTLFYFPVSNQPYNSLKFEGILPPVPSCSGIRIYHILIKRKGLTIQQTQLIVTFNQASASSCEGTPLVSPDKKTPTSFQYIYFDIQKGSDQIDVGGFETADQAACEPFTYNLKRVEFPLLSLPSFISFNQDHKLLVSAPSEPYLYEDRWYSFYLTALDQQQKLSLNILFLKIYDGSKCKIDYAGPQNNDKTYYIGDQFLTFTLKSFFANEHCPTRNIRYESNFKDGSPFTDAINFQKEVSTYTVSCMEPDCEGIYPITLIAFLDQGFPTSLDFTLFIKKSTKKNRAPFFITPLQNQEVEAGKSSQFRLPKFEDKDKNEIFIKVMMKDGSELPQFMSYQDRTFKLSPSINETGDYQIAIILYDHGKPEPAQADYQFLVQIVQPRPDPANRYAQGFSALNASKTEFKISLQKVDSRGILTLSFTTEIMQPPNLARLINRQNIHIYLVKGIGNEVTEIDWEVYKIFKQSLQVKLLFSSPEKISLFQKRDTLNVLFEDSSMFISSETGKYLFQREILKCNLPPQQGNSGKNFELSSASQFAEITSNTLVIGNMVLNIFLSTSLQMLWGMINTLQLIVNLPFFSLPYPSNVLSFFNLLLGIVKFDLLPSEAIVTGVFEFSEEDSESSYNFEMMDIL